MRIYLHCSGKRDVVAQDICDTHATCIGARCVPIRNYARLRERSLYLSLFHATCISALQVRSMYPVFPSRCDVYAALQAQVCTRPVARDGVDCVNVAATAEVAAGAAVRILSAAARPALLINYRCAVIVATEVHWPPGHIIAALTEPSVTN